VSDWLVTAEWDWVWLGAGNVLHAVDTLDNADTVDDDWYGVGRTECGQGGHMTIPGLFSRMGAIRCVRCCKATGMPQGEQSPKNDDGCRPIVEARIAALPSKEQG
jgi:hypothetical protein